jgi:hypothetical protein
MPADEAAHFSTLSTALRATDDATNSSAYRAAYYRTQQKADSDSMIMLVKTACSM